jgi:hypothetical protein
MNDTDDKLQWIINDIFSRRGGWRLTEKGNLTTGSPSGWRLTVFERPKGSGRYAWSMSNSVTVSYSPRSYPTQQEAKEAVIAEEATRRERGDFRPKGTGSLTGG